MRYSYSLCALCFVLSILTPDVARAQTLADCSKILKSDEFSFVFLRRLRFGDGRRELVPVVWTTFPRR
jgi:hypothetical protein